MVVFCEVLFTYYGSSHAIPLTSILLPLGTRRDDRGAVFFDLINENGLVILTVYLSSIYKCDNDSCVNTITYEYPGKLSFSGGLESLYL